MSREPADSQLQRIAQKFRWITRIVAPDAPGFVFYGGELDPRDVGLAGYEHTLSLSGKGLDAAAAFAGCVGEGVEQLSRLDWGDGRFARATSQTADHGLRAEELAEILRLAGHEAERDTSELDWMAATRLSDGAAVLVPANLCIRCMHPVVTALPSALSTGCAAGPSVEAATLAALLEVIERDAVALWWSGGRRGHAFAINTLAQSGAAQLVNQLRQGTDGRVTWLIDLTSDLEIPCVAALSATPDGRGFACGTAARPTVDEAIRAAFLELCQSELGHHLVAAKRRARGEGALNEVDRRKLDRAMKLDARCCELLYPAGFPVDPPARQPLAADAAMREIVGHCHRVGVDPLVVDLTRPELGVPAARVIVPGLQPFPSSLKTDRLMRTVRALGPRASGLVGMPLF